MRIGVLPTGKLEWHGLGKSLAKLFPGHEFFTACEEAALDDGGIVHSVTSSDVTRVRWEKKNGERILTDAERLISLALGAALGDSKQKPADLVLIVDDVELVNMHQVEAVLEMMRRAAKSHLQSLEPEYITKAAKCLREKVSFHLAKPMIEAWFFASEASLRALPIREDRGPKLMSRDIEDFESADPAYLQENGADCICFEDFYAKWARRGSKKSKPPRLAWDRENRERHPKSYLSWLCLDSTTKTCSAYGETGPGTEALLAMDWQELLGREGSAPFARALVEDIAVFLGVDEPFPEASSPW